MANTYTFTLSGSRVLVEVFDQTPTLIDNYTLSTEHNVFVHPNKNNTIVITQNTNYQGVDQVTYEYNIGQITGNPDPADPLATVVWLADEFFVGAGGEGAAGGATEATLVSLKAAIDAMAIDIGDIETINSTINVNVADLEALLTASNVLLATIDADTGSILTKLTSAAQTPSRSLVTDAVGISAGFKAVTVENVGSADGTFLGVTLEPGQFREYSVTHLDATLGAFAYNATGTTFEINTLS